MKRHFVYHIESKSINRSPNQLIPYSRSESIVCRFGDALMAGATVLEGPLVEAGLKTFIKRGVEKWRLKIKSSSPT